MRIRLLLTVALLAGACAIRAEDADLEAEELFTSLFRSEEAGTPAPGSAWAARTYGVQAVGGYYGSPSPSPSPSAEPSPSPSTEPSPSPSPSAEPSPSPSAEPSPSPSPSAEPSPSPSTAPGDVGQAGEPSIPTSPPACAGVAFQNGYLTSCEVFADSNKDSSKSSGEPLATATNGAFSFISGTTADALGTLYVVPASESSQAVAADSSVCHDATTLLAVHFPYAAPRPPTCTTKAIISPLTSLLVHGASRDLTLPTLLASLSLPTNYALLTTDSLAGFIAGEADSRKVYRREVQLLQTTLSCAKFLTKSSAHLPAARKFFMAALAQQMMSVSTRRRLLTTTVDLSQSATVSALLTAANTIAASGIPAEDLTAVSPETLAAVSNAIATLSAIIENSPDLAKIQKAAVVAQTTLADKVAGLIAGTITPADFAAGTTTAALEADIVAASLPGTPAGEEKKKSNAVALGVGLGLGLGLPLIMACAAAVWYYGKGARSRRSGLQTPMMA